jgi:predicted PurR-regulated permease PerM
LWVKYKKVFYCILLLVFFIVFTYLIKNYFKPFFLIVFFTLFSMPIYNICCKYKLFTLKANAIISIICVNLIIFISVFFIGNFILNQLQSFNYNAMEEVLRKVSTVINVNFDDINSKLRVFYLNLLNSDFLKKGAAYTTDGLFAYLIGNIAAYFILVDKYHMYHWFIKIFPPSKSNIIKEKLEDIIKMVEVELVLVILTTIETIFGFLALDMENAIMLGFICGILDVLPYVGTIIIFLPLIIYKFVIKQYIIAVGLILLYILIAFIRQVMEMKFMSSKLKLHPLYIMVSLYIGLKLFGLVGLFIGPIYVIIAKEIIVTT